MDNKFTYRDKYGSFELYQIGCVAEVHVVGACGTKLMEHLTNDLMEIAEACKPSKWGYVSVSPSVDATSPTAEIAMVEMTEKMIASGCVVDAYHLNSALSIAQTERIRKKAGVTADIRDVLFDNADDARAFVQSYLRKINGS